MSVMFGFVRVPPLTFNTPPPLVTVMAPLFVNVPPAIVIVDEWLNVPLLDAVPLLSVME